MSLDIKKIEFMFYSLTFNFLVLGFCLCRDVFIFVQHNFETLLLIYLLIAKLYFNYFIIYIEVLTE